MKKILLSLMLSASVLLVNAQASKNEQSKVQESIVKFFDGLSELDAAKLKMYSTNDFMLLENAEVWNLDSLTKNFEQYRSRNMIRVNSFDFIKTEVTGKTAWVAYHNSAAIKIKDRDVKINWLESAVLVMEGGIWKIKLMHSTVVPKPK
ncbi:nuclear transport factor 2 family protein [Pedobacter metabolipauper]|uniref:Uncharacterized protein DUF4440 n=1 Tax=Pedobacter metabolipauper TaxID=425513 RepID=A0A4R6SRT3_9SPHI|nr:nuclear transport factor 2 family protein [Pedobacter metabolipauper]TDQ07100.1 uncharacterized protein DUF4440 [Pedobacter metabolipauper]